MSKDWLLSILISILLLVGFIYFVETNTTKSTPQKQATIPNTGANSTPATPTQATQNANPEEPDESGEIVKCTVNGKTTYSNKGCAAGQKKSSVKIANSGGFVSPDRKMIEATREKIRNEIRNDVGPSGVISDTTKPENQELCDTLKSRVAYLDIASRQRQSGQSLERIRIEKMNLQSQSFHLNCN